MRFLVDFFSFHYYQYTCVTMFAQLQFAIDDAKLTFLTTTKKEQIENAKKIVP